MRISLQQLIVTTLCLFLTATAVAEKPADIAKTHNRQAELLQDELDSLQRKLNTGGMSLSEASRIINQKSSINRKLDSLWDKTESAMTSYTKESRSRARRYESENKSVKLESALAGSQIDLLNNVAKYPTKESFEKNKDSMSRNWEREFGYRFKPFGKEFARKKKELFERMRKRYGVEPSERIGIVNPYTGEVYYKYYGEGGELKAGAWVNDAAGMEKWRGELSQRRFRLLEQKVQYQKDSAAFDEFEKGYSKSKDKTLKSFDSIRRQATRVVKRSSDGQLSSSSVRISVVDSNSVLDDEYQLYVNGRYQGLVRNRTGGQTSYSVNLKGGLNRIDLRLHRRRGKGTKLRISIYTSRGREFSRQFKGTRTHSWKIFAPAH